MGRIRRVLRCYNCGAILQSTNKGEPGYINNPVVLQNAGEDGVLYCQKCFDRMKLINSSVLNQNVDKETIKILDDAVATDATIVWVIDLFSFNGTLIPGIVKKVKKLKIIVIGTHRDLLPKQLKNDNIINYINERFGEYGITPAAVTLVGNAENIDVTKMMAGAHKIREGHDMYLIGTIGSGKTTLINKFLKVYENSTKWAIKTETYPGTNSKVMAIPLSNSSFLYELPGLSLTTSVAGLVEKDVAKLITPKNRIAVYVRTLSKGEAIAVGSLACFELVSGHTTPFTFYSAEGVETKKIFGKNISTYREMNNKKRFCRPVSERYQTFRDYDLFEYTMEEDDQKHDIAIEGLGWVTFVAKGQVIRVHLPKGAALKESLSKVR